MIITNGIGKGTKMEEPIRILHVIGKMDRAGAETMIMNLYRTINRSKIQFDFMVHSSEKGDYDDEILALGGKIYHVPYFNVANYFDYTKKWKEFFKSHSEHKIVHGHIGSSAAIYLKIAKKFGKYTIAHSHALNSTIFSERIKYGIVSYPTRHIADYFLACSLLAGQDRFGEKVVKGNRFSVLKNAIQSDNFSYSDEVKEKKLQELGLKDKFVIGHIGRLALAKNHTFLLDVFKEVAYKKNNAVLVLVGIGPLEDKIKQKVKDLKIEDKVIFLGLRKDIPELLQAMDIFVFPSLYEGLGVVVVEAQATGINCIISDTVPDEVDIHADLLQSLPLAKPASYWAKKILETRINNRYSRQSEVIESGYDIKATVNWLQDFYLEQEIDRIRN